MSDQARQSLISIVLPTYNGARYLAESIQSCIDQTYTKWELIIVDDCSTDTTPEIIQRYCAQDPRIRSIRHEQNRKLPASLNTGFAAARGDLYTWTSDDNRYLPEALARMQGFLERNKQVGIVYAGYENIDEAGNRLETTKAPLPDTLTVRNAVSCCFLYRKEISKQVGEYNEELFLAEDYDYWLRASIFAKISPLPVILYQYRRHGNTLTELRQNDIAKAVYNTLSNHLKNMDWLPSTARANGYIRLFTLAKDLQIRTQALIHLAHAFFYAPIIAVKAVLPTKMKKLFRRIRFSL